jgi:hypothetical protein
VTGRKWRPACVAVFWNWWKNMKKSNSENELMEANILTQKSEIERELKETEADPCSQIDRLKRENRERKDDRKKIKRAPYGQIKLLKKRSAERESDKENVEHALCSEIGELMATLQRTDIGSKERSMLGGLKFFFHGVGSDRCHVSAN